MRVYRTRLIIGQDYARDTLPEMGLVVAVLALGKPEPFGPAPAETSELTLLVR